MRIGISCYPTFGGSGVVASELGMGLARRGHQVHFITYAVPGRLNLYQKGIYFHEVSVPQYPLFEYAPYSQALASKMSLVAEAEDLQLIHAHYAIPHAASALLAKAILGGNRLKVVVTLHGTDITLVGLSPYFLPVVKYAIETSDASSVVSEYLKDQVCAHFNCRPEPRVIYNFVNRDQLDGLDAGTVKARFAPNGEKLLVHVSNFRPVKRVQDVMEVFACVRREMPARLILVGRGPELPRAEGMAVEGGYSAEVFSLGDTPRALEVIAGCDLLLLPSDGESFGMTALEAMAVGVPPIATMSGGTPEVVEDGVSGRLLPVGDVEGMSRAALELLRDDRLRARMGEAGEKRAFEHFNIETALDQYEELYASALEGA